MSDRPDPNHSFVDFDSMDLLSPSSTKRRACLQSLDGILSKDLTQVLIDIDQVPATITSYRDRERYLDSLSRFFGEDSGKNDVVMFRFLVGTLYINFEKFWGPTVRTILELLDKSRSRTDLLDDLIAHLGRTNDLIYENTLEKEICDPTDRPDHVLHRNFIFQIMHKFSHHAQSNHLFMDEFFRFVHEELHSSPFIENYSRFNLLDLGGEDIEIEIDDASMNADKEDEKAEKAEKYVVRENAMRVTRNRKHKGKIPRPAIARQKSKSKETFITAAKVIQSFTAIDNIHRSDELKCLLLDLLSCRDSSVQKASFNCLILDLSENVRPYANKVLKLINEKMARTEISTFSFESNEFNQVKEGAREELMPIILRVLFGKMVGKIGKKSTGRDKADLRKTLVMRCIAGCSTSEILFFFSLLFNPIGAFLDTPFNQLETEVRRGSDFENYVPLNKLQAMIASLAAAISSIAHLNEDILPYIFKLICIISCHVIIPLDDIEVFQKLSSKKQDALKVLRRGCLNITTEFFRTFEYYRFNHDEINFIFEKLVWNSARGFIDRNFAYPTPLLKFIDCLTSNRVYHKLLVKRNVSNNQEFLLNHLVNLYGDHKTERRILKLVATMLSNLIQPNRDSDSIDGDNREHRPIPMLEDEDAVIPDYDAASYIIPEDIEFSHEILISFIPCIFERLKRNCQNFVENKTPDSRIENDELSLLSALSPYLKNSEQSVLACKLLLLTLNNHKKAELIEQTLKTAQTLMQQVVGHSDEALIGHIADILGYQRNLIQRRELCTLLDVIAQSDSRISDASQSIRLMNSLHDDLIDQPDLVKCTEGFHLAFKFLDALSESDVNRPEVVKNSLNLLIHQVAYIISCLDRFEFSIRDNCQVFFEKLTTKLELLDVATNKAMVNEIVSKILLEKFIKKGLRSSNETIKNTYVSVLRSLAIHCHSLNKTLKEFHLFCSDNQDSDFWLNIKHIQLHNRSKALAKLVSDPRLETVSSKTLSSYFLPIASGFLFSKAFKTVSSLSENSIKMIGIICRHLNWMTYEATLSYYLGLLTKANNTYQTSNIKLITEILKNFSFDITACREATQNEDENAKLEKRMKRKGNGGIGPDKLLKMKKLNQSTARMIYISVTHKLIPRLNACLHEMTRVEYEHDKNMANYLPEKDEIRRIPIAYAIVQLLNLLPCRCLRFRDHLPQLFLKLSSFLKSKSEQVRKVARSVIVKIMNFVGPAYIPELLRALKHSLSKGFQVHVMNYTLHSVLEKISLSYGDLDNSLEEIVDCCFKEIFGQASEDKEVAQILSKTFEAKKTKSYDTLMIVASCINAEKLDFLMDSIKIVLKTSNEVRKVNKIAHCINRVFTGLAKNDQFPLDRLFAFIETTIVESIPSLKIRQKTDRVEGQKPIVMMREDRYLIEKDLPRDRIKSRINERGNFHMLVENCLRLLLHIFEKYRNQIRNQSSLKAKLDNFINLLTKCLKSSSPKCVTRALKCIYFITRTKAALPTFKVKSSSIVQKIFVLLSLYNGVGMVQGDNSEMISMCFKTLTVLLLKCEHVELNQDQVRALLVYIEQDLHDPSRQITAFGSLNSLLKKKCDSPELGDIMVKVADLLVTSENPSVRNQSIISWEIYLLDYKHEGDKLRVYLTSFLRQLDYEFVDGRKAVLRLLEIVVTKFPGAILNGYFELMFHILAERLANDDSHDIRQSVGHLIGAMLQKLPERRKASFDKFVVPWASGNSINIQLLGIKLMSVFIESCKNLFADSINRVRTILSSILNALERYDFRKTLQQSQILCEENGQDTPAPSVVSDNAITAQDKLSYHSLRLFRRILMINLISPIEKRHVDILSRIWLNIATKQLKHEHLPVVSTSCEIFIIFLTQVDLIPTLKSAPDTKDEESYLGRNAKRIVRLLCDNFIDLLDVAGENRHLLNLITQGLISLGQIVANSHGTLEFERRYLSSFENEDVVSHILSMDEIPKDGFDLERLPYRMNEAKRRLDLMWLAVKVVMQARKEAALYRMSSSFRRDFVLKWLAAISQELGARRLSPYVFLFLMTPVRELTDKGKSKTAEQGVTLLSGDLLKFIKNLIGVEAFNQIYSKLQLHYTRKRISRKHKEAVSKVRDQARGVKRKLKKNQDKIVRKKKKIMDIRRDKGHLRST